MQSWKKTYDDNTVLYKSYTTCSIRTVYTIQAPVYKHTSGHTERHRLHIVRSNERADVFTRRPKKPDSKTRCVYRHNDMMDNVQRHTLTGS